MKRFSLLALISLVTLFSCNKDKNQSGHGDVLFEQSSLKMKPVFGPADLALDSVYTMSNGFQIQFTELKAYFTDIQSGGNVLKDAALFDFRLTGTQVFQVAQQPVFNPTSIQFGIGVPESINHNDPSAFPSANPLNSIIANDMHWDWNPGYIFFKVEAKVDTIPDGITNCDHNVIYHVGTDPYFTAKTISNLQWLEPYSGSHVATLKLDLKNFFEHSGNAIDVKTEFTTHSAPGQEAVTEKARQNFAASISAL